MDSECGRRRRRRVLLYKELMRGGEWVEIGFGAVCEYILHDKQFVCSCSMKGLLRWDSKLPYF